MTEQLVGVVVGGAIGLGGAYARDWWTWKRQRNAMRAIIGFENEDNLVLLGMLWRRATMPRPIGLPHEEQLIHLASHLTFAQTPKWHHKVWDAHLGNIATAFSPVEIQILRECHNGMERISGIQEELREIRESELAWLDAHNGEENPRGRKRHHERLRELWREYEGIYEGIWSNSEILLLEVKGKFPSGKYGRLDKPPY